MSQNLSTRFICHTLDRQTLRLTEIFTKEIPTYLSNQLTDLLIKYVYSVRDCLMYVHTCT